MNNLLASLEENEALLTAQPRSRLLPPPRPRLLLADDDRGIRESLGKLLRNFGYHVTLASHGGQVLEKAFNEDFDLLLLDLNMPEMDGWESLSHVQNFKPNLPIIVITAQPNQRSWIRNSGARVLMEKPLDLPLLLATVRELLDENLDSEREPQAEQTQRFRHLPPKLAEFNFTKRLWGLNE